MTDKAISPLRRRMIEDMTIRKLAAKTQHDYVQRVKDFAVFLRRSPATASKEHVRRYQLHLASSGDRLLHGQLCWLCPFQDFVHIRGRLPGKIGQVHSVGHESSEIHKFPGCPHCRQSAVRSKARDASVFATASG
jgi:Phage integrase, N-terminal SAM-like domain